MALHARLFTHNILRVSKLKKWSQSTQAIERSSEKSTPVSCMQPTNAAMEQYKGREGESSRPQCLTPLHWSFQPFILESVAPAYPQAMDRVPHVTSHPPVKTSNKIMKTHDKSLIAAMSPQDHLPLILRSVAYTTDDIIVCQRNRADSLGQGTVYENHPVIMLTEWGKSSSQVFADTTKGKDFDSSSETVSSVPHRHHFRRHSICDSNPTQHQPHYTTDCSVVLQGGVGESGAEDVLCSPIPDSDTAHATLHCSSLGDGQKSVGKGGGQGPTLEQLRAVETYFIESLPKFFKSRLDYRVFHPEIVFENNFWGENQVSVGINQYAIQMTKLRALTHLKFAHVHMEVVSSACVLEEGVIRIQWRIVGLSQLKALRFWKYTAWNYGKAFKEDAEWLEAISTLHVNKDGLVTKHRIDRMTPSEEGASKTPSLAAKLALLFGLSAPRPSLSDFNSFLCQR